MKQIREKLIKVSESESVQRYIITGTFIGLVNVVRPRNYIYSRNLQLTLRLFIWNLVSLITSYKNKRHLILINKCIGYKVNDGLKSESVAVMVTIG
jgi:hypothetical protein